MNAQRVFRVSVLAITILLWAVGNAEADFVFGTPTNLGPAVNSPVHEAAAWVIPDELSVYFWRGPA